MAYLGRASHIAACARLAIYVISQSDLECEKQTVLTTRPAQVICRRAICRQACRVFFRIFRKIFLFPLTPNHF
jgi:hypothetical protein